MEILREEEGVVCFCVDLGQQGGCYEGKVWGWCVVGEWQARQYIGGAGFGGRGAIAVFGDQKE